MKDFIAITKALSDEARVRALAALSGGELCLCQIVELLGLAPSTASRHMSLLFQAGLVRRRKEGRWHYFKLAGREASPTVRRAIKWTLDAVEHEPVMIGDAERMCCVREADVNDLAGCCYGGA